MRSTFEPRDYQREAIAELYRQVWEGLVANRADPTAPPRHVIFKSPTGSGKTAMASIVLRRLATEATEFDLAGIWIAPNKLHEQARHSAEGVTEGAVRCALRDSVGPTLDANEVLFINWDSLNKADKSSFRQVHEENPYLRSLIESARVVGRDVIVVIDESHRNTGTKPSLDVLDEIGPAVVIEMSATIKGATVDVKRPRVVAEGIVRSEVIANLGVADGMGRDDFLDLALAKRVELGEAYAAREARVNPLLIVQLPDGKRGDQELAWVVDALHDRGITALSDRNPDGRLVIWLSDQKSLADRLDPRLVANDGPIKVLICKQAIAIGWDCPRAQVLYKIRSKSDSDTFDVQTVGRILRAAEPHHGKPYGDLLLDRAYVYHHDREYEATEDYGLRTAFAYLRETVPSPRLDTQVMVPNPARVGPEQIADAIGIAFERLGLVAGATPRVDLAAVGHTELLAGGVIREEGQTARGGHLVRTLRSEPQIQADFTALVASWAGGSEEGGMMRDEIYWHLRPMGVSVEQTQRAFLEAANARIIETEVRRALSEVRARDGLVASRVAQTFTWTLPPMRDYNDAQDIKEGESALHERVDDPDGLYAYDPCYLRANRSKPELRLEEWLRGRADIALWWSKNGETAKRDFSIVYELEGQSANFFPDYVVSYRDGTIGLYETKDEAAFSGRDAGENRAKATALAQYTATHAGVEGAFVLPFGTDLLFYADADTDPRSARTVERAHGV